MTTAREQRQRREQDVTGQIEGRYAARAPALLREYDACVATSAATPPVSPGSGCRIATKIGNGSVNQYSSHEPVRTNSQFGTMCRS